MPKKTLVLLCTVAVALAFHACTLPTSVIIKGKPKISLPAKINAQDFNELILETIKSSTQDQDMKVLDYTSFFANGKNIQAFLIQFPIIADYDLGLGDEITKIKDFEIELDKNDLNQDFDIGDLGNLNDAIAPIEDYEVKLTELFGTIEDIINNGFIGQSSVSAPFVVGSGADVDDFPDFGGTSLSLSRVEMVEFSEGTFEAFIRILPGPNVPGTDITFSNLRIYDGFHPAIYYEDSMGMPKDVHLTASYLEEAIIFDLAGKKLNKNFGVYIHYKDDNSTGTAREIELEIEPFVVDNIKIRSMIGAQIDSSAVETEEQIIPIDFPHGGFVHAEIERGTLEFEVDFPSIENGDDLSTSPSWFSGFTAYPKLKIIQDHSDPDSDGTIWPGINKSNSLLPATPDPWDFNGFSNSLNGKHINTKDIVILDTSEIELSSPYASFWLNDTDLSNEKIFITIHPKLHIDSFEWVHADIGTDLAANVPVVPPVPLGGAATYLKSITFNEVGPIFSFGKVDIPDLEIMLSIPDLDINPSKTYKPVVPNMQLDFINNNPGYTLMVRDSMGIQLISDLNVEFDIRPIGGKNVIAFQGLSPSNTILKIEVTDVEFIYDWDHAVLDLSSIAAVDNYYPNIGEDPVDMSAMYQYLEGWEFAHLKAWLYVNGPSILFDLDPQIDIQIHYTDSGGDPAIEDLLGSNFSPIRSPPLNLDPANTGTYTGNLPQGGAPIENIHLALENNAEDLRFYYSISLEDEVIVYPAMMENIDVDTKVDAEILVLFPLLITAGPNGADIKMPDMFEGKADILNRDQSSEPLSLDFIKKLSLKVALNDDIFTGGNIFLDDGQRRIEFPLGNKSLKLAIAGDDLDYINNTIPYKPEIGVNFAPGTRVQIARNIGTIKVDIDAELKYELKLKNF